jgi:hypothetical protein
MMKTRKFVSESFEGGKVDGEPEMRDHLGPTSGFQQWRQSEPKQDDRLEIHPQRNEPPRIDAMERSLVLAFLRRYLTHCARRGRTTAAEAAAGLWRELRQATN